MLENEIVLYYYKYKDKLTAFNTDRKTQHKGEVEDGNDRMPKL